MSLTSIPANFYSGASETLRELMWSRLNKVQKGLYTDPPPANFMNNPNITQTTREQAWLRLSDAQKKAAREAAPTTPSNVLLSSGGQSSTSYRSGSWSSTVPGSGSGATTPLDFSGRLESRSAEADEATRRAYRNLWSSGTASDPQARLEQVLAKTDGSGTLPESGNGGALFVTIRGGTGAERATNPYTDIAGRTDDRYDVFNRQIDAQVKDITDRFGQGQALMGYDLNGDGSLNSETELFGFDGSKPGLSLDDIYVASAGRSLGALLRSAGNRVELDELGDVGKRLMVLRSDGSSVRMNQSSIASSAIPGGGYTEHTAAQTALQLSSSGKLELTVYTQQGFDVNLADAGGTGTTATSFRGQTASASQTPTSSTVTDFTNLFPNDEALGAVLKMVGDNTDTNGGAVFLNVRPASGAEINTAGASDPAQAQSDALTVAGNLAGLFHRPQVMLAYDKDGNGSLFAADGSLQLDELFGFDAPSGAGMKVQDLLDDIAGESDGVLNLSKTTGGKIPDYNSLFALTYDGSSFTSVRLNQATGPTGSENVVGQTGLRLTSGKLELVAYAGTNITV